MAFSNELAKCRNDEDVKQVGIEWGAQQAKELVAANVPCLHFYTMGRSEAVRSILEKVR